MLNKTKRDPRRGAATGVNRAHRAYLARERRLDGLAALCGASLVFLVGLAVVPALLGMLWFLVALALTF